jgi:hypothetical protein
VKCKYDRIKQMLFAKDTNLNTETKHSDLDLCQGPTAVKKATSTLVAATVLGEELMLC